MRREVIRWGAACVLVAATAGAIVSGNRGAPPVGTIDRPIGWAGVEGGTDGGSGGRRVTVADADSLIREAGREEPLTIGIEGTIRLARAVRVRPNKTLLGRTGSVVLGGGFQLTKTSNVILRNLTIRDAPDAISVEQGTHHIWIDHCDLSHCRDGLLDIKRGSDFVTVSWNHFHDHRKTALLGHSDSETVRALDRGHLRVTYHHNFFDGTRTRHPRVRVGEPVHVFNNYFLNNDYGVASTTDAGVVVEGNYFENVPHPTYTRYGDSKEPGRLVERHNLFVRSGAPESRGTVTDPGRSYRYTLDRAADVPSKVRGGAGVGKIGW